MDAPKSVWASFCCCQADSSQVSATALLVQYLIASADRASVCPIARLASPVACLKCHRLCLPNARTSSSMSIGNHS